MSRKVLCSDCGFLCWNIEDESGEGFTRTGTVRKSSRESFQEGKSDGQNELWAPDYRGTCSLGCLRGLWNWTHPASTQVSSESVTAEELRKQRKCIYFAKYDPGHSPEEHKELKRESDTRRALVNATLWGALIGAGAAIAAQIVYALLAN